MSVVPMPFMCGITTRLDLVGRLYHISVELDARHDRPLPVDDGCMSDDLLYRHMVICMDTGRMVDSYVGPHFA